MQKYRNRIIAGLAISLLIYIVLLIFLDSSGQFDEGVVQALQRFPMWLLGVLALTQISAGVFRFLEWHYFLGVIDARDKISLKDSVIIFVTGFTFVVSPGKIAEVLKSVFLKMKTGVPIAVSAPVILAERIVDGLAVIVTLFTVLLLGGDNLNLGTYRGLAEGVVYSSAAALVFGLVAVQVRPLAYFCLGIVARIPIIKRLHGPLTAFYESSREIFKLKHVIPTTIMGLGVYLSSTVGFVIILWGFDVEVSGELFIQAAFMVGVASAIGALSFVPNGAGVTEVSNAAMLIAIVSPEHPELTTGAATAAALIQGFYHKWFRVVVGASVALIFRKRLFTSELETELAELDAEKQTTQAETLHRPEPA